MKLQSLATVTGYSSSGVSNKIFFADAKLEAELPSSFLGVVVGLTAKPFSFLVILLLSTSKTRYNELFTLLCNIYVDFSLRGEKNKSAKTPLHKF